MKYLAYVFYVLAALLTVMTLVLLFISVNQPWILLPAAAMAVVAYKVLALACTLDIENSANM
ncbi:MAG: hypothetical protein MJK15_00725 [Colwellia sp.]|nr:hypothetical protein [Colwellia sp.]